MQYIENQETKKYIRACRETIALCNSLSPQEKEKIPFSLIRAICDYAGLEKPEDQEAVGITALQDIQDMTSVIMEVVFFYSGEVEKGEAIRNIRKSTKLQERGFIRQILLRKQAIELTSKH